MNITDVDDKILARAAEMGEGTDPIALARRYEAEFWADLDGLNVLRPDVITRVTEHVEGAIVPYIGRMVDGGMAYVLKDDNEGDGGGGSSSVYFDVAAFEAAGGGGSTGTASLPRPSQRRRRPTAATDWRTTTPTRSTGPTLVSPSTASRGRLASAPPRACRTT